MLTSSLSPHIHSPQRVSRIMWHVSLALLPAVLTALWFFGVGAATVIAVSIAGCMVFEYLISRYIMGRKESTLPNGSAFLTGLLLALNLPSNLPWWIVLIGALVAIGIGKMCYGGLGCNIFNPALVGRVFLLLSFPAQMTTWPLPLVNRWVWGPDAQTGATTLGQLQADAISGATTHFVPDLHALAIGQVGGSLGEVGAIALLLGGIYLLWRGIITWHIPVSIILTVALFCWPMGLDVPVQLLSGGLLLGAIFMATDYVTSPMTHHGMIIYGIGIGLLTVVIRQWSAYPEGVSFAILLMNGVTPLINRYCKPRRFGAERRAAA